MIKHADVWRAIDRLAKKHGMSASALARRSGLDSTTFNKSKRITLTTIALNDSSLQWFEACT